MMNVCPMCGRELCYGRCDCGYKQKQMALKITTANKREIIELEDLGYRTLQTEIGGYIEMVRPCRLPEDIVMLVDEEGLFKNLPLNPVGSWLYGTDWHGAPIVGDVLILGQSEDPEADFVGLSLEQLMKICDALIAMGDNGKL